MEWKSEATLHKIIPMFIRVPIFAVACILIGFCAGCATTSYTVPGPKPTLLSELESRGVSQATVSRIEAGRVLSYPEILELVRAGIPGNQIVAYLKKTRAPYNMSQTQINGLVDAGADSTLINYVGRGAGDFLLDAQNEAQQSSLLRQQQFDQSFWDDPYFNDPGYMGAPPFGFGWPGMWY